MISIQIPIPYHVPDAEFSLSFIHSVSKTRVIDVYENRLKAPGRTIHLNQWEDHALLLYIK